MCRVFYVVLLSLKCLQYSWNFIFVTCISPNKHSCDLTCSSWYLALFFSVPTGATGTYPARPSGFWMRKGMEKPPLMEGETRIGLLASRLASRERRYSALSCTAAPFFDSPYPLCQTEIQRGCTCSSQKEWSQIMLDAICLLYSV